MEEQSTPHRPLPVTLAVVLLMLLAAFGVLESLVILLARYDPATVAAGNVLVVSLAGAAGILLSLLLGTIVAAVWRGSGVARIVVTIVIAGDLALDVVTLLGSPAELWWTVFDAVFYLLVLLALWAGRRTAAFFSPPRRGRDAPATAA